MSIKTFINVLEEIRNSDGTFETALGQGFQDKMDNLFIEAKGNSELAESVIKEKISEEKFVKFVLMIQKMCVSYAAAGGNGTALILSDVSGELQAYTQTVILSTIGALIQEDIL